MPFSISVCRGLGLGIFLYVLVVVVAVGTLGMYLIDCLCFPSTYLVGMNINAYLFLLTPVCGRYFEPSLFCGIGNPHVVGRVLTPLSSRPKSEGLVTIYWLSDLKLLKGLVEGSTSGGPP